MGGFAGTSAEGPFGDGEVDDPAGEHQQRSGEFAGLADDEDPGQVGQELCARAEADRVTADHPGAVPGDVAPPYRGRFRAGGFSTDLTHHVMHTLGSRMWGFTQELFDASPGLDPELRAAMLREMAATYPHIVEMATSGIHDEGSVVDQGCDDQFESSSSRSTFSWTGSSDCANRGGHPPGDPPAPNVPA